MKARLVPVYFVEGRDEDFDLQLARLKELLSNQADFLPPVGPDHLPPLPINDWSLAR